jgi:hypothetical protein
MSTTWEGPSSSPRGHLPRTTSLWRSLFHYHKNPRSPSSCPSQSQLPTQCKRQLCIVSNSSTANWRNIGSRCWVTSISLPSRTLSNSKWPIRMRPTQPLVSGSIFDLAYSLASDLVPLWFEHLCLWTSHNRLEQGLGQEGCPLRLRQLQIRWL